MNSAAIDSIAQLPFIDEIIRELSTQNTDEKISEFLISISKKGRLGVYRKNK